MLEHGERLLVLVLENTEVFPFQVPDGTILLISDTDVDFGEIDIHIQLENVVFLSPQKRRNQQITNSKNLCFHQAINCRGL